MGKYRFSDAEKALESEYESDGETKYHRKKPLGEGAYAKSTRVRIN